MISRCAVRQKALAALLLFALAACGTGAEESASISQPPAPETAASEEGAGSASEMAPLPDRPAQPEDSPNPSPAQPAALEPVYSLAATNASHTAEVREITAGDTFLGWDVMQAEHHPYAGEGYPTSVIAEFAAESVTLTGMLAVSDGGMDGIAAFYPDEASMELLPAIVMVDRHIGSAELFSTGEYGADVELYSGFGMGRWEGVTIRVNRVFLGIHAPSYSRSIHTIEVVDPGTKISDYPDANNEPPEVSD